MKVKTLKQNIKILIFIGISSYACDQNSDPKTIIIQNSGVELCAQSKFLSIKKINNDYLVSVCYDASVQPTQFYLSQKEPKILEPGVCYIKIPISKMIALSSSHIGMLRELHAEKCVVGVSGKAFLCDPTIFQENIPEFMDLGNSALESVLATNAQLIMYSGFETKPTLITKLENTELIGIPNYDWREETPLGRAEWIKLFGVLCGKEELAVSNYAKMELRYVALKNSVTKIKNKPKVFSGSMIGDVWYSPGGSSYLAQLFEDAGADYVLKNNKINASIALTLEEAYITNKTVPFWFNDIATSLGELKSINIRYSKFEAFKKSNIYSNKQQSNCFWEQSSSRPDLVLEDFIHIFHGNSKTIQPNYYNRLQ
jgi:iron complex transport system substrate-binding protein